MQPSWGGTFYGSVVVPGDSRHSILNMLVEERAGELSRMLETNQMPVTVREIELLQLWGEQRRSLTSAARKAAS